MQTDAGLPILVQTLCRVDCHIWVTTGERQAGVTRCDCGRNVWPEVVARDQRGEDEPR